MWAEIRTTSCSWDGVWQALKCIPGWDTWGIKEMNLVTYMILIRMLTGKYLFVFQISTRRHVCCWALRFCNSSIMYDFEYVITFDFFRKQTRYSRNLIIPALTVIIKWHILLCNKFWVDNGNMRGDFLVLFLVYNQVVNTWNGDLVQIKHLLKFLMHMRKIVYIQRSSVSNYKNYLNIRMKFQMLTVLFPQSKQ